MKSPLPDIRETLWRGRLGRQHWTNILIPCRRAFSRIARVTAKLSLEGACYFDMPASSGGAQSVLGSHTRRHARLADREWVKMWAACWSRTCSSVNMETDQCHRT